MQNSNKIERFKTDHAKPISVSNIHPQFELNEMEATFHQAILKQQADDNPFTYIKRTDTKATIIKVNHKRASAEEAIIFKEFMIINMHQGHKQFIIDLSNTEFMDSTFLGSIIIVTKRLRREKGDLSIVAEPQKLKVLHVLNELRNTLKVFKTMEEAIKELNY